MFLSSSKRPLDIKTGAPEEEQVSSINKNFQTIYSQIENLSNAGTSPLLLNHPISKLSPDRLVYSNNKSEATSVTDLSKWILGTNNQINVRDLGNGKVRLSLPYNMAVGGALTVPAITVTGLTPLRLVATDAANALVSVGNLTAWVAGTANQVNVANDGDGTITLSTPQDIAAASSPTFTGLTLSGLTASRIVATNGASALASVAALTAWVAGTANQVIVTDDLDGTITLSTPQDIAAASSPTFAGGTFNGNVGITTGSELRLWNAANTFYTGFRAPAIVAGNVMYTMPLVDGGAGTFLQTNGAGTLIWAAAGGGAPGGANTNVQYNNAGAFGGDANFTYDAAGTVYAGVAYNVAAAGSYNFGGVVVIRQTANGIFMGTGINIPAGASANSVYIGNNHGGAAANGARQNVAIGDGCLTALTSGDDNIAIGHVTLASISTGLRNVGVGGVSGNLISTGDDNTLLGYQAGAALTTQDDNTFVGARSGLVCISSGNTAVGKDSAVALTTGSDNLFFGLSVGTSLTTGSGNILIGINAGATASNTNYSIYIGYNSGRNNNTVGSIFIGYYAGYTNTNNAGNTIIGYSAFQFSDAAYNTIIGYEAGRTSALNSMGGYNTVVGYQSAYNSTGATYSAFFGYQAGYANQNNGNVFLGYYSGRNNVSGSNNVMIGYYAGGNSGNCAKCVYIGYAAGASATTSNRLHIDYQDVATSLIYGEFDNDIVRIHGNLEYKNPAFSRCDGYVMREPAELTTANAVQTTLDSITLLDENTYHVKAFVTGVKSDGSQRASYELACTVYRTGAGVATLQGAVTVIHSQESDATWDATFTVNGNDLRVSVTGVAATTIYWAGTLHYINTSN